MDFLDEVVTRNWKQVPTLLHRNPGFWELLTWAKFCEGRTQLDFCLLSSDPQQHSSLTYIPQGFHITGKEGHPRGRNLGYSWIYAYWESPVIFKVRREGSWLSSKMKRIGELGGGLIINHLNPPILQGAGQMSPSPGAVSLSPHKSCHLFLTCPHTVG